MKYLLMVKYISILFVSYIILQCSPSGNQAVVVKNRDHTMKEKVAEEPDGHKIYDIYCLMCHGADGKRILTGYYDLAESSLSLEEIISVTRDGRNAMLPYSSVLNQDELRAVAEYTHSLRPE